MAFLFHEYFLYRVALVKKRPEMYSSWSVEMEFCGMLASWELASTKKSNEFVWEELWRKKLPLGRTIAGSIPLIKYSKTEVELANRRIMSAITKIMDELQVRKISHEKIFKYVRDTIKNPPYYLDPHRLECYVISILHLVEVMHFGRSKGVVSEMWLDAISGLHRRSHLRLADIGEQKRFVDDKEDVEMSLILERMSEIEEEVLQSTGSLL